MPTTKTKPKSKLHPADVKWLEDNDACPVSKSWLTRSGFTSLHQAWNNCKVGSWMDFALTADAYPAEALALLFKQFNSGHTCTKYISLPSLSCKACNAWANELRQLVPNPFPYRRAPRATPKRAAKTAKGVKKS